MIGRRVVGLALLALCAGCVTQSARRVPESEKAQIAIASAERWAELVDDGHFEDSWKQGAEYFRNAVPSNQWAQALRAGRAPLGKIVYRRLRSVVHSTSLPGAPDGDYFTIQFDTQFERKQSAIETFVPMRDTDGVWRISGYFIR